MLVSPGDAEALMVALLRVLGDPALRQRLAARGRETFEQRFSADALMRSLQETYRR